MPCCAEQNWTEFQYMHLSSTFWLEHGWQMVSKVLPSMAPDMMPGKHGWAVFGTIGGFTFGIVFGTLMVSRYGGQSYHFAQSQAHDTVQQSEQSSDCIKFAVFSTQRSGSGFLIDALNHQPEVFCGDEFVRDFSHQPEAEVSANWMDEVDRIFDRVCKDAQSQGKKIAGFKIMYSHVRGKRHKVDGVDLPREWFKDYLQKRHVRILHLVREAAILTMSSMKLLTRNKNAFHLAKKDTFHTNNSTIATATMNSSTKLSFGKNSLKQLRKEEHELLAWTAFLPHLGLPYHYVRYEDLTSTSQDVFVYMMLQFLGVKDRVSYPKFQSQYYLSHHARCEDRIHNFEDEVKLLIRGTMSERACAMLEYSNLV
eukprot:Skav231173  [mRNA]  locus=scaffold3252:341411:342511:- [translate_table: standard]